ncbi:ABC transporter permease [Tellurirhabdus rosea]|uniref:ABC transporter permease n=1 Tax=Tellurirhabdus rosea TaxID=2674997 RepID=UPI00224DFCF5|nr:ABC transporter permease [Tellurirhabdus rosea]
MNLLKISWANLRDKPLSSFLSGLLMTLGISIISLLLLLNKQLTEQFNRNIKGVDMVIGAKGSPLQLILSSIYQIDSPTGNIPLEEAERLAQNPMVKTAIPLAMGDNFRSFRIVGTDKQYVDHYGAKVGEGRLFAKDLEVTIGARVAEAAGLKIGDSFAGAHGLDEEGEAHKEAQYKVVGVFSPAGSVIDQLILTNVSSVWAIHEHHEAGETASAGASAAKEEHHDEEEHEGEEHSDEAPAQQVAQAKPQPPAGGRRMPMLAVPGPPPADEHEEDEEHHDEAREITSMLIKFRNPMGMMLARNINMNTKMQAAVPAIEVDRLFSLLGVGIDTLRGLAVAIMLIAGISVFVSLYNSLKDRKYEMALMLSMGGTRTQLFGMLLLEGLVLALLGFVLGLALSRLGLLIFSARYASDYHYNLNDLSLLPEEWALLGVAVLIGVLAAALPALGIYRMNISRTLAEE